jgi:hypothetical protein
MKMKKESEGLNNIVLPSTSKPTIQNKTYQDKSRKFKIIT